MADNRRDDLFRRLTQLFRGGPSIKRKVRAFRTPSASTAVEVFKKSYSQVYSNALNAYGQYDRMSRYADFSEMEYTPEISSALDIYSEESCSVDEKGTVLHVYSENPKVQELLDELYHDVLNVEHNLSPWTRNLTKYGDFFAFIDVHPELGVINAFPMPVNEVERDEGWDPEDPLAVRFRWVTQGNQLLDAWQVAHFRLVGNDAFLPYGSSILESARRIWRQLVLIEDAMLVYRVVRSPERRIFYIDVGTVPAEEIPNYMEAAQSKLKRAQVIDKQSGRIDLRYNPLCFSGDTLIPLLDGRTLSIKELVDEWQSGRRDQETYSIDTSKKGQIIPGRVVWCGKSGVSKRMATITLDDGGIIRVTPDHKMMLRDGSYIEASALQPGMSLMPLYVSYSDMQGNEYETPTKSCYEKVFNPSTGCKYFTHRLIAANKLGLELYGNGLISQQGHVIHHRDFNKLNNSTQNLEYMTNEEHSRYHSELGRENIIRYNQSTEKRARTSELNKLNKTGERMGAVYNGSALHKEHNAIRSAAMKKIWDDETRRVEVSQNMKFRLSAECDARIKSVIRGLNKFEGLDAFCKRLRGDEVFCALYTTANAHLARDPLKSFHKGCLGKLIIADYADFKSMFAAHNPTALGRKYVNNVDVDVKAKDCSNNHNVVSVVIDDCVDEDVYNITIDVVHNLAIQSAYTKGSKRGIIFAWQSVDEDYFIPIRGDQSGTRIETLAGGQHVSDIADVEYIQKKLFSALKVPKAYLGYDEALSSKATLCLRSNTLIKLTDGRTLSIRDLVSAFETGERLETYSYDISNSTIVPGTISRAWATKQVDQLYRVTLDSGDIVECTENHPFLMRDGSYVRADNLKQDDSLMPLHTKLSSRLDGDIIDGYEHRVVSVEVIKLDEPEWVYDLTVDGYHNFALGCGIFVHNSQEDIRFSRAVARIQSVIISELEKIGQIHLFAHGYEGEDLLDFKLRLSNPSTIAQMQKLELWRTKFEIAGTAPPALVDREFIRKELLELSDTQIERIEDGLRRDKQTDLELEAAELEGNQPKGGSAPGGLGGLGGLGGPPPSGEEEGPEGGEGPEGAGAGAGPGAGGEEKAGGKEEEGSLFAGEEPERDLLTGSDDMDDEISRERDDDGDRADDGTPDHVSLDRIIHRIGKANDDKPPVKSTALSKRLYDRSRHRHHGARTTHMPDFKDMLVKPIDDPFDRRFFNSNPFKREAVGLDRALLDEAELLSTPKPKGRVSAEMRSTLASLGRYLEVRRQQAGTQRQAGLLEEGIDDDDDVDVVLEDDAVQGDDDDVIDLGAPDEEV